MKNKIIQTASQLFLSLGFKSVTMDDIAAKMAISKKTIYECFQSKTALVKATTHYVFEQVSHKIDGICCKECDTNPIHTLFHINNFLLKELKANNAPDREHIKLVVCLLPIPHSSNIPNTLSTNAAIKPINPK